MKIAFVDSVGDCAPVAYHCELSGNKVLYLLTDKDDINSQRVLDGMVDKAKSVKDIIAFNPDVVVCYQDPEAGVQLQKAGIPYVGPSEESIELEEDRLLAMKLCKKYGCGEVPRVMEFSDRRKALEFVKNDENEAWVFKAEGGESDTSTTHVCETKAEMAAVIEYEADRSASNFILQEKIDGVEISIEGWFDYRKGWIYPINSTFERKELFNDDKGPKMGCTGSIVFIWPEDEPRLFKETLQNFTPYLEEIKYVGPFDGNFIVADDDHKPYFLEFTPRLGWNAFSAFMAGYDRDVGEMFARLAAGNLSALSFRDAFMGAVRVYIPTTENMPIVAPWRGDHHFYPINVWFDGTRLRSTGSADESGFSAIFDAGTSRDTIPEIMEKIYERVIPRIQVPAISYRTDIGKQAQKDIGKLKDWGYTLPEQAPDRGVAPRAMTQMMGARKVRS